MELCQLLYFPATHCKLYNPERQVRGRTLAFNCTFATAVCFGGHIKYIRVPLREVFPGSDPRREVLVPCLYLLSKLRYYDGRKLSSKCSKQGLWGSEGAHICTTLLHRLTSTAKVWFITDIITKFQQRQLLRILLRPYL